VKEISNEWLKSAKSDLDTIEAILDNQSLTQIVAFHAQQCIEKCLKAIIEEHELPAGKIHNLITLKSIVSKVINFDFDEDLLGLLNTLYVDSRYPGDLGLMPNGKPTLKDAKEFDALAIKVYKEVRAFLLRLRSRTSEVLPL
jgi:HEPN domain-containing protein